MENSHEKKVLEELKSGSENAFKRIYQDNRLKFIGFALKYDLSNDEIVDIYQDACIVLYENVRRGKLIELTSSISTYLISIGKYMILARLRKLDKLVYNENIMEKVHAEDSNLDIDLTDEKALTKEQKLLYNHFDLLGAKCRKILTLFYYRGYTIEEIMISEGYNNENVVKSQKSRCLKELKELIMKPR